MPALTALSSGVATARQVTVSVDVPAATRLPRTGVDVTAFVAAGLLLTLVAVALAVCMRRTGGERA